CRCSRPALLVSSWVRIPPPALKTFRISNYFRKFLCLGGIFHYYYFFCSFLSRTLFSQVSFFFNFPCFKRLFCGPRNFYVSNQSEQFLEVVDKSSGSVSF